MKWFWQVSPVRQYWLLFVLPKAIWMLMQR